MAAQQTGALGVRREPPPVREPAGADLSTPAEPADERHCARPGCTARAHATLVFSYGEQRAVLSGLAGEPRPQAYDLCPTHAARTSAPYGWQLRDERSEDERRIYDAPTVPADLGGDRTVAVLAEALRAVPGPQASSDRTDAEPDETTVVSMGDGPADPAAVIDELIDAPDPQDSSAAAVPGGSGDSPGAGRRPRPVLAARARTSEAAGPGAPAAEW